MRTLFFCAVMFLAFPAAGQNLIADPSFENGNVASCSLGLLPDTWFKVSGTPDTFSGNCALSAGADVNLPPGHFATLTGGASDGRRFVAAASDPAQPDAFGQHLAAPLQADQAYRVGVRAARSSVTTGTAYLDVYLATSPSLASGLLVATLNGSLASSAWTDLQTVFCAPVDASGRSYLLVRPRFVSTNAYLALDEFELTAVAEECQAFGIPGLGPVGWGALALLLVAFGLTARRRRLPLRG